MTTENLDFSPVRVDSHPNGYIIIGTGGELAKYNQNIEKIGESVKPFPSPITSSAIVGDFWIGAWVDHDLRQSRMAAIEIDSQWKNGDTRSNLRDILRVASIHPAGNTWSQSLDAEPMGLSSINDSLCFATFNRGIYCITEDSTEVWRAAHEFPNSGIKNRQEFCKSFHFVNDEVILWSNAGSVIAYSQNGEVLWEKTHNLPELIDAVFHDEKAGWFISMNGRGFAIISEIGEAPILHSAPGPVSHAIAKDGGWIWTGWRHDGSLINGEKNIAERDEIGVALLGETVLTNEGTFDSIRI